MAWLLLHGTPLDPECWAAVADRLAPDGRVEVPSVPPLPGDACPQQDIAGRLAHDLGEGERDLDVVGHSFGGQIALEVALARPDRVRTLTVICSRATPFPPFADVAAELRRGVPVDVEAGVSRWFAPEELAADGAAVTYARAALARADRVAWASALDAIATYDSSTRLSAIDVPAYLVAAQLDPVSTPAAMAEAVAGIPGAELEVLPGAAHMSPFTDPDALAARLRFAAARA